jgi:hypothetical protein
MALGWNNHHTLTPQANQSSPYQESFDLADVSTAIVVTITIYDTSSTDGVVSGITFAGDSMTEIFKYYDSVCDGHISAWLLNNPNTSGSQPLIVSFGGTVTDLMGSVSEVTGGSIEEDVSSSLVTGSSSPLYVGWTSTPSETHLGIGCMVTDQATVGRLSTPVPALEIHITDLGSDCCGASRNTYVSGPGAKAFQWIDSDADEDWCGAAASLKIVPAQDPIGFVAGQLNKNKIQHMLVR